MFLKSSIIGFGFAVLSVCSACSPKATQPDVPVLKQQIIQTLKKQDEAWNRGDIDAFMEDYLKSDALRFASAGDVERGWQATLDRYNKRYPDKAAMGTLSFTDMEIDILTHEDALVFGRWTLDRENDRPNGLFTLRMHKQNGRWLIMSDHTSSANP